MLLNLSAAFVTTDNEMLQHRLESIAGLAELIFKSIDLNHSLKTVI